MHNNLHYRTAESIVDFVAAQPVPSREARLQLSIQEAQARATLALADAQHTANLIALYNSGGADGLQGLDYNELLEQIRKGLGL